MVGNVALGSEQLIRVQTMTTNGTNDVAATVEQVGMTPEGVEVPCNLMD